MSATSDLTGAVRDLIARKFAMNAVSEETDLLAEGVLDSVTLVHLILSLEENFGIQIELNELEIDDLRSIYSIANLVSKLQLVNCDSELRPVRAVAGSLSA